MIVIGDVHGKIHQYLELLNSLPDEEATFQLGDMGLGFKGVNLPKLEERHRFIRGNHDDPAMCKEHPNYAGEFGADIREDIEPSDVVLGTAGYSADDITPYPEAPLTQNGLFFIGGAFSIDWAWRRASMLQGSAPLWWPDEELSESQLETCSKLYETLKPRVVLSHDCPIVANQVMLHGILVQSPANSYYQEKRECSSSRTCRWMQRMFDAHKPELWVFGHYHIAKEFVIEGTKFVCVPELGTYTIEL